MNETAMLVSQLAVQLNGCDYREGPSEELIQYAKDNKLVIVFGYSDDGIEFRGALNDEFGAPGLVHLDHRGFIKSECDDYSCPYFKRLLEDSVTIESFWDEKPNRIWSYKTKIPHSVFTMKEDGEEMAEGIVFSMEALSDTHHYEVTEKYA